MLVYIIGKDIIRFHGIYWPIFLHALGLELPKKIYAHSWIVMKDGKIVKTSDKSLVSIIEEEGYEKYKRVEE